MIHYDLFNHLGSYRNIMELQISSRKETCKEILESSRLKFLEIFSANHFRLSDAEDNTSGLLNLGGIVDLLFLNTESNLPNVLRAKFLRSGGLFRFISICKFGSINNTPAKITSLPELYFRFRRFIFLIQIKKVILMNYGSSTSCWKPWRWVRLDIILLMKDIYINSNMNPLTKFTSSSKALSLNISSHGRSLNLSLFLFFSLMQHCKYQNYFVFCWATSGFLINICFSIPSVYAKKKFWVVPNFLQMCVFFW